MYPFYVSHIDNLTLTIDGTVRASEDNINWPNGTDQRALNFWSITDSKNLHVRGSGMVDGQGYWWWMREYAVKNHAGRPHLIRLERIQHALVEGVTF